MTKRFMGFLGAIVMVLLLAENSITAFAYSTEAAFTPPPPTSYFTISGKITDFYGPVRDDGTVPWYVDWVRIEIENEDGTPAVIIGVHQTAFFFGEPPVAGMEVRAYISDNSPTFVNDVPLYVVSAIVAGMPPDVNVKVCWFIADSDIFVNIDGSFSFKTNEDTLITHTERLYWSTSRENWCFAEWLNSPWRTGTIGEAVAVVYTDTDEGIPTASRAVVLFDELPISPWTWWGDIPEGYIDFTFEEYIFPQSDFETIDLPIIVNGVVIEAPTPFLAADGITVMVPFRPIMMSGAGFGNYARLEPNGRFFFGGGGGGSENSHWELGNTEVRRFGTPGQLCVPPIIIDGVIYVPLLSSFAHAAPFAGAWLFDDWIDVYNTDRFRHGSWFGGFVFDMELQELNFIHQGEIYTTDKITEMVAAMPIVVNGAKIDATAVFGGSEVMVPLVPIMEALWRDILFIGEDNTTLTDAYGNPWWGSRSIIDGEIYIPLCNFVNVITWRTNAIIYDGQIMINDVSRWKYPNEQVRQIIEDFLFENYRGFFTFEYMYEEFPEIRTLDGIEHVVMSTHWASSFSIAIPHEVRESDAEDVLPRILVRYTDGGSGPHITYQYIDGRYQRTRYYMEAGRLHKHLYDLKDQVTESIQQRLWPNLVTLPCGTVVPAHFHDNLIALVLAFFEEMDEDITVVSIKNSTFAENLLHVETIKYPSLPKERYWLEISREGYSWFIDSHRIAYWWHWDFDIENCRRQVRITSETELDSEPWRKAYAAQLSDYTWQGIEMFFFLYDIDSNGIPELFIAGRHDDKIVDAVYKFRDGKAISLKYEEDVQIAGFALSARSGVIPAPDSSPGLISYIVGPGSMFGASASYTRIVIDRHRLIIDAQGRRYVDVVTLHELFDSLDIDPNCAALDAAIQEHIHWLINDISVSEEEFNGIFGTWDTKGYYQLYPVRITESNINEQLRKRCAT